MIPPPEFEQSLGANIGRTGKLMGRALIQRFREAGHDIQMDHWMVLVHLWHQDGQNQQLLGEQAGRTKTSVTRAIDSLEQKNLVVRVPDKTDRRHKLIYLTHQGRELKQTLFPYALEMISKATQGIPEVEIETCISVLKRIFDNMSTHIKS